MHRHEKQRNESIQREVLFNCFLHHSSKWRLLVELRLFLLFLYYHHLLHLYRLLQMSMTKRIIRIGKFFIIFLLYKRIPIICRKRNNATWVSALLAVSITVLLMVSLSTFKTEIPSTIITITAIVTTQSKFVSLNNILYFFL